MYNIRFEANGNVNPKDLYHWLSQNWKPTTKPSAQSLLYVARCIANGEGWQPDYHELSDEVRRKLREGFSSDILKLVKFEVDDPYEREHVERQKQWALVADLLKRGAAGDADAAIKYCQLEAEGKISHGAFA